MDEFGNYCSACGKYDIIKVVDGNCPFTGYKNPSNSSSGSSGTSELIRTEKCPSKEEREKIAVKCST